MTWQLAAVYCRRVVLSLIAPAAYLVCLFIIPHYGEINRSTSARWILAGIVASLAAILCEYFARSGSRVIAYLNFFWLLNGLLSLMALYGPVPG